MNKKIIYTTKEAVQALTDAIISKWQWMVDNPEVIELIKDGIIDEQICSLCTLFDNENNLGLYSYNNACLNCPIYKDTGENKCADTPYRLWIKEETLINAKAELEYLIDLKNRCEIKGAEK